VSLLFGAMLGRGFLSFCRWFCCRRALGPLIFVVCLAFGPSFICCFPDLLVGRGLWPIIRSKLPSAFYFSCDSVTVQSFSPKPLLRVTPWFGISTHRFMKRLPQGL
jgi:hypothetical protein